MNEAFPKSYFDRLGLISLLDQLRNFNFLREPPDADPHVRWCGRTGAVRLPPTR